MREIIGEGWSPVSIQFINEGQYDVGLNQGGFGWPWSNDRVLMGGCFVKCISIFDGFHLFRWGGGRASLLANAHFGGEFVAPMPPII